MRDDRTAEQRRADVTADLFEHILHNGLDWLGHRLPDQHRRRPHIEVIIPATTLLGLDNNPAELTGYGPIPAHLARRIATNGTWRRLLTDPTNGTVLEASTTRHDPGTLVTETLLARHPVCAWPGCNRTSRECDRDHTTPYTQTGTHHPHRARALLRVPPRHQRHPRLGLDQHQPPRRLRHPHRTHRPPLYNSPARPRPHHTGARHPDPPPF